MDRDDSPGSAPSRRSTLAGPVRAFSDNLDGVLWMLVAVTFFTAGGLVMKHLAQTVPITMIVFFRNWVVLVVVLPILLHNPPQRLRPQRLWIHVLVVVVGQARITAPAIGDYPRARRRGPGNEGIAPSPGWRRLPALRIRCAS